LLPCPLALNITLMMQQVSVKVCGTWVLFTFKITYRQFKISVTIKGVRKISIQAQSLKRKWRLLLFIFFFLKTFEWQNLDKEIIVQFGFGKTTKAGFSEPKLNNNLCLN
jgi:hypothetical protein